jgi:2-polyprenyl-3-methyl-5-hydroxy-6-metoxy-1,4-benzoquinol methylase
MTNNQVQDIIQWDVKSWSRALLYWNSKIEPKKNQVGLELGGREGGLSLWLALNGVSTVCSDLTAVESTASQLHEKHNIKSLIEYENIDATAIPYENHFDIIVFKSIIGGIGSNDSISKQELVFNQIYKALKPGGKLFFAENLKAGSLHQYFRKKYTNWGSSWRYVTMREMNHFLRDFSKKEILSTGVLATFGRNEKQRNFFASVDNYFLNFICPKNWKYICYGYAQK